MKIEVINDQVRKKKIIEVDDRDLMNQKFAGEIFERTIDKISSTIAQEYLEANRTKILAGIDVDVVRDFVNVSIASKVQADHDRLMARIDPLAKSIPSLNSAHNSNMMRILQG